MRDTRDTLGSVRRVLLGAHCSGGVKKALDRAAELELDSLQLFVQSPRAWRFPDHDPKDLAASGNGAQELGIGGVLVHSLYLVNLASPNDEFYEKSVTTMRSTVDTAVRARGRRGVPRRLPPGRRLRGGARARGSGAARRSLERCSDTTWLLLENSAGAGGTIGRSVEELAALFDALGRPPAARRLPRLVPPVGVRLRRHRPGRARRAARRARRPDRPRPPTRAARQRRAGAARLEPRPPRERPRGPDGREARRLPRPPEAPGTARSAGGSRRRQPRARTRRR